ncbi:MAG: DUF6249 domain-containing protein [bacterium]
MRKFLPATILLITLAAIWAGPALAQEETGEPTAATAETHGKGIKIAIGSGDEDPCADEDLAPLEPDSEVRKMKVMIPIFGMMVPIIFILGVAAVIVVALLMAHRAAQMRQETIQLAIKEGRELPPELFMRMRYPRHPPPLLGGLILTALGIALSIALGVVCGPVQAVWGLIPLFIGVAILIYVPLYRKQKKEEADR